MFFDLMQDILGINSQSRIPLSRNGMASRDDRKQSLVGLLFRSATE